MTILSTTKESDVEIHDLRVNFEGVRYVGEGELRWIPSEGFKIQASLSPLGKQRSRTISIGGGGPIPRRRIGFKIYNVWRAFSTQVFINSWQFLEVSLKKKFTAEFDTLVLSSSSNLLSKVSSTSGACTFLLGNFADLPDYIEKKVTLGGEILTSEKARRGLSFRDNDLEITGFMDENHHLEIAWKYLSSRYSKTNDWSMAIAMRDALSISTGCTARLLRRELYRPKKTFAEFITKRPVTNLGYFSPIADIDLFDKRLFGNLLQIFIANNVNATLCRNLFYSIADALNTRNKQLMEFLIASSLEAFLRTFDNRPRTGSRSTDKWHLDGSLKNFQEKYLSGEKKKEWKKICSKVKEYHSVLRNRAGHPDWLASENSSADVKSREPYDQMEFLCRFYGYMILAIAGYENLRPEKLKI